MPHTCRDEEELAELRPHVLEELKVADEEYPDDLINTYKGLLEGRMIGDAWVSSHRKDCGCFYGHLGGLNFTTAYHRAQTIEDRLDPQVVSDYDELTPIQYLIEYLYTPGETPETCRDLALLKACIEELHPEFLKEAVS